jgi:cell division protein FtsL
MVFAWQHFQCVSYGYRIEQLREKQAAMQEWNHALKVECASLTDPGRIDTLARTDLGLVPPKPNQIIQVGNNTGASPKPSDVEFAGNFHAPIKIPSER